MEIAELRYFLAVAREGSYTLAAESMHITQPGLSRAIIRMEEELGKKLFIRENRKLTLTEDGILLRKRAGEIVDLMDKTESEFHENNEDITGDIYIGSGETESMKFITEVIEDLYKKYPNIHYHFFSGNAEDVKERLDKGLLDFGIFIGSTDLVKYDYLKLPVSDTWGVLMRKDSEFSSLEYITPEILLKMPLFCSRQTLVRNEFSSWLGTDFEKLNVIGTYNLIYSAGLSVSQGVGNALCLDRLVNTNGTNLCFVPLKPTISANLVISWKKYQIFSKTTQLFLKELRNKINVDNKK